MSELPSDPVKRKCRYCGRRYVVQKWGHSEGCTDCAPRIEQAIADAERVEAVKAHRERER